MSDIDAVVREHIDRLVAEEDQRVESLLAEAMMLQDFNHLDRLITVYFWPGGPPTTVASLLARTDAEHGC